MGVSIISELTTPARMLRRDFVKGQQVYIHTILRDLHGARMTHSELTLSRSMYLAFPTTCEFCDRSWIAAPAMRVRVQQSRSGHAAWTGARVRGTSVARSHFVNYP